VLLPDVNVLIYAHREESASHSRFRRWLEGVAESDASFGLADLVLSWFLRVVTNPRVMDPPSPFTDALSFVEELRAQPNATIITPGGRHWDIFTRLCRATEARGNLIADAYLAALAIESGSEWITTDRDYARFPGLRWRHPLEGA
jgi:toxin-antitoxin system PIN domain toxin